MIWIKVQFVEFFEIKFFFFCEFLTISTTSYTICCTWFIWKFFLNRSKCFQREKFNENIPRWNQNFSCNVHTEFFFIKIIRLNHQFQIHTQVLQPCSLKNIFLVFQDYGKFDKTFQHKLFSLLNFIFLQKPVNKKG